MVTVSRYGLSGMAAVEADDGTVVEAVDGRENDEEVIEIAGKKTFFENTIAT
jgi:hypothetical protein